MYAGMKVRDRNVGPFQYRGLTIAGTHSAGVHHLPRTVHLFSSLFIAPTAISAGWSE